jgi:outer membrane protein TolC
VNKPIKKFVVVSAVLMAGCAVGPDFERPAAPPVKAYTAAPLPQHTAAVKAADGQSQQFMDGADIPAQWWELFHSPALNQLVESALKANPNLQSAQASLREAHEYVLAARGELLPSVNANGSATRERFVGAQFGQPNYPGSSFSLYNASISVSYGIDLFGEARRALESVAAQEEFQRFQLEGAYLTLTSNVVTAAVQ